MWRIICAQCELREGPFWYLTTLTKLISSRLVTLLTRCFDTDQPPNPIRLTLPASVCKPQWNQNTLEFASFQELANLATLQAFFLTFEYGDAILGHRATSESYLINSCHGCACARKCGQKTPNLDHVICSWIISYI